MQKPVSTSDMVILSPSNDFNPSIQGGIGKIIHNLSKTFTASLFSRLSYSLWPITMIIGVTVRGDFEIISSLLKKSISISSSILKYG